MGIINISPNVLQLHIRDVYSQKGIWGSASYYASASGSQVKKNECFTR